MRISSACFPRTSCLRLLLCSFSRCPCFDSQKQVKVKQKARGMQAIRAVMIGTPSQQVKQPGPAGQSGIAAPGSAASWQPTVYRTPYTHQLPSEEAAAVDPEELTRAAGRIAARPLEDKHQAEPREVSAPRSPHKNDSRIIVLPRSFWPGGCLLGAVKEIS